jgi:hypothetical protein
MSTPAAREGSVQIVGDAVAEAVSDAIVYGVLAQRLHLHMVGAESRGALGAICEECQQWFNHPV